jgi:hypothetical protein
VALHSRAMLRNSQNAMVREHVQVMVNINQLSSLQAGTMIVQERHIVEPNEFHFQSVARVAKRVSCDSSEAKPIGF